MKDDQCGRTVAISLIVSLKPPHYGRSSKVERDEKSVAKLPECVHCYNEHLLTS